MEEICKNWSTWLRKTRFSYMNEAQIEQTMNFLLAIREIVLNMAEIQAGQKVADFGCGSGLLSFGILERFKNEVELIFSDKFQDCLDECQNILNNTNITHNATFLKSDICDIKLQNDYLDRALTRSVLVHVKDKPLAFSELHRVIKPQGMYCAFEPIISENTKYYELVDENKISNYSEFKKAEMEFMSNQDDALVNFNANSLDKDLENAGFSNVTINVNPVKSKYIATQDTIKSWFVAPPGPGQKTVKERFLDYFEEKKVDDYINEVIVALSDKEVEISTNTALIKAIK